MTECKEMFGEYYGHKKSRIKRDFSESFQINP